MRQAIADGHVNVTIIELGRKDDAEGDHDAVEEDA